MTKARALAIAATLAAAAAASEARAQTFSAGSYYDETASAFCPASASCRIDFTRLSKTPTMLRHIFCRVTSVWPVRFATFGVATTAGGTMARQMPLTPRLLYGSGQTQIYTLDMDVHFFMGQSLYPQIAVTSDGSLPDVTCTIVGSTTEKSPGGF